MKTDKLKSTSSQLISKELDLEKLKGKNLFPEQLARMNEILAKAGFPMREKSYNR